MSKPEQVWWWEDAADGSYSEVCTRNGGELVVHAVASVHAVAWQPVDDDHRRDYSWETAIAVRSTGLGLSLESSKVDAEAALRRDAEKIAAALGGKVVW